ncbi:MAG: Lpg1974 family pore-forming outer membrane protein, partial [Ignavibacteriales bacterium]
YYQSEAWTRVFNTPGYDKLKAYTNVNLAAIFSNEDAGWKVMAYVKNAFDKDNITGAFLNSDDTGLTTNVFLNEPRLYGLRVTKEWTGGPWWTGANANHVSPYPLTIEVGGQVQRQDAPYETLGAEMAAVFPSSLNPLGVQHRDLDWGDGREVNIVYRPQGSTWSVAGGFRYGRTNSSTARLRQEQPAGPAHCAFLTTGKYGALGREGCDPNYVLYAFGMVFDLYSPLNLQGGTDWSDASARSHEEHLIADFDVGREVGLGAQLRSSVSLGLRFADFRSQTDVAMNGVPDMNVPEGWDMGGGFKYPTTLHRYETQISADRRFRGAGPTLKVGVEKQLWGRDETGQLNANLAVGGGILIGRQTVRQQGFGQSGYWSGFYLSLSPRTLTQVERTDINLHRSTSATVPILNFDLGLSYEIQRLELSTGYRWERYFNAIDGGYAEHKSYDRTIDGPYFKIAVGFGG